MAGLPAFTAEGPQVIDDLAQPAAAALQGFHPGVNPLGRPARVDALNGKLRRRGRFGNDRDVVAVLADRGQRLPIALTHLAFLGQRRAGLVIGVQDQAVQTVQALAVVDLAVGVDGQRAAVLGAGLALVAVGLAL